MISGETESMLMSFATKALALGTLFSVTADPGPV